MRDGAPVKGGGADVAERLAESRASGRPLFERYPALAREVAWVSLATLPTPIERVELDSGAASSRSVLVKRDDLTGRPYGGNKVRKLEFILAEARRRGAERVITAGAAGSHHALATTVYARALGMDVTLVLFPQSRNEHVRKVLLMDHALGAELCFTSRMETVPLALARAHRRHRRKKPFAIAPGGSDPLGTLGYVNAGLELAAQLDDGAVERPASIHLATGTMGTVAGLALGLALAGLEIPITATRITRRLLTNRTGLRRLIRRTAAVLRRGGVSDPPIQRASAMVAITHDQIGAGYGRETPAAREAAAVFARAGLVLDATYTAKAAASLLATPARSVGLPLFLHTLSAVEPVEVVQAASVADLPEPFRRYLDP